MEKDLLLKGVRGDDLISHDCMIDASQTFSNLFLLVLIHFTPAARKHTAVQNSCLLNSYVFPQPTVQAL